MNIIKRELKANLISLIVWSVVISAIVAIAATEFNAFKDMANVDEMLSAFPQGLRDAFSFDVIRFDQPQGYYSYIGQYFMMMAVIFATLSGTKILSKEISKRTAETTFTLPVTRRYIISMKLIAAIINCVLLTLIIFGASYAAFSSFDIDKYFVGRLSLLMLFILLLQLLFVLAGLFASVLTKSHKRIGSMMTSITIGVYMVSFIVNLSNKYDFLKYLSPFEYFPAIDIMHGNELELYGFIVVPLLIITFFFTSFILVEKKDIL